MTHRPPHQQTSPAPVADCPRRCPRTVCHGGGHTELPGPPACNTARCLRAASGYTRLAGSGTWLVWCGIMWCGIVLCDIVWCGIMWCDIACGAHVPPDHGPPLAHDPTRVAHTARQVAHAVSVHTGLWGTPGAGSSPVRLVAAGVQYVKYCRSPVRVCCWRGHRAVAAPAAAPGRQWLGTGGAGRAWTCTTMNAAHHECTGSVHTRP